MAKPAIAPRTITIPFNFVPRGYQLPLLRAMDSGATRGVAIWHRRAGKDRTCFNYMIKRSQQQVGTYHYLFPTYGQAKKVIWEGIGSDGFPMLGHAPAEVLHPRGGRHDTDLKLTFRNGSIIQLIGADSYDSVIGTNPIGTVWSEYSLQNPSAWDYYRPILRENGGWAIFNYTPRGRNHGWDMFERAKQLMDAGDRAWFVSRLSVEDTGVLTAADIEAERREGMDEEMIAQEFYCSFEGSRQGSIYGKQLAEAEAEGRICPVPWQRDAKVNTWWDIGTGDPTAIWFTQDIGREIHVIDYYENSGVGVGVDHYVRHLRSLPYIYGAHNGPHDLNHHQFAANGKSAWEVARALGLTFEVVPDVDRTAGINAGRALMGRCWFDRAKTELGRKALAEYHYTWDEKRKMFLSTPYHSWASNGADAFQQIGLGQRGDSRYSEHNHNEVGSQLQSAVGSYDVFGGLRGRR